MERLVVTMSGAVKTKMLAQIPMKCDLDSTPDREDAAEAVRTLIRWVGENPYREGLRDTPERVLKAYEEFFAGYAEDPRAVLSATFEETKDYTGMVVLKGVDFVSHCEHHIVPLVGVAHVAYVPDNRVVGISKLARVVELCARRLQIQERMTSEIAEIIDTVLKPLGVAVLVEAKHQCMTTRGVQKPGVSMVTNAFSGVFKPNGEDREDFLRQVSSGKTF
jgi:GTP cyclohydrolase IA